MNGTTWNGYPMWKGRGSFLLSDGDILTLSADVHLMFCSDDCMEEEDFDMVQQIEMEVSEGISDIDSQTVLLISPGPR